MAQYHEIECINCNKVTKQQKYSSSGKYCSITCQQNYQHKQYIARWKDGIEDGISGAKGTRRPIKAYIFEKYGSKCVECGWGEKHPTDGRIPLEVDHIDGDYTNNKEENLRLLCPNCHSLTPTYKSRNRGKSTRSFSSRSIAGDAPDL